MGEAGGTYVYHPTNVGEVDRVGAKGTEGHKVTRRTLSDVKGCCSLYWPKPLKKKVEFILLWEPFVASTIILTACGF